MSDVTFGVKVNAELKDKLTGLMKESGLQGKDFMQSLINLYEMENTKSHTPEIAQDIVELQCLTQRINSIYINLAHRIDNIKNCNDEIYQNNMKKKEEKINSLEDDVTEIKCKNEKLSKQMDELKILNEKTKETASQLEDINNSNKLLIKEYNEKLYSLSNKLNEFQKYAEENNTSKKNILELESTNSVLKNDIEKLKHSMQKEIHNRDTKISALENSITLIQKENEDKIKNLNDKLQLERERCILEKEKEYHHKTNSLINEYNLKIKNLLNDLESAKREPNKDEISKNSL